MELPESLIDYEILPRLPAETVVRFRSVCKSWLSLFSSPEFIKSHLTHHNSNRKDYLMGKRCLNSEVVYIASRYNYTYFEAFPTTGGHLIGSINGLVLLAVYDKFWLWNLAIRQYKPINNIPKKVFPIWIKYCRTSVYGLGWDPVQNDYKVVVVFVSKNLRQCFVYSSNSNSWTKRNINSSQFLLDCDAITPTTFVKGCPYWSYSRFVIVSEKSYKNTVVFKFVAEDNEFKQLPDFDNSVTQGQVFKLVNKNDCLAGVAYKPEAANIFVDVYVLNEDCDVWSKMYSVCPINLSPWIVSVQGFYS